MTKHRIIKSSVLFAIVACLAVGFTGCKTKCHIVGISDYYYENSENYTAGEAELSETVENIDINWVVGSVTVLPHTENTVCLSEESELELAEDIKLRYWLDDTTLRIKFCACRKMDFSDLEKDLTVLVPDTLILNNLKVSTLSADVNLSDCAVTQSVKVNTVSGTLNADFSQPLNEFRGDSTSGSFTVIAPSVSRFQVGTVSGVVSLSAEKEPDWLNFDSTSGNINLVLPESSSFTLDYDATSGDLSSELPYRKSSGKYIFGDGKGEYNIATVSGDVRITANKQEG